MVKLILTFSLFVFFFFQVNVKFQVKHTHQLIYLDSQQFTGRLWEARTHQRSTKEVGKSKTLSNLSNVRLPTLSSSKRRKRKRRRQNSKSLLSALLSQLFCSYGVSHCPTDRNMSQTAPPHESNVIFVKNFILLSSLTGLFS